MKFDPFAVCRRGCRQEDLEQMPAFCGSGNDHVCRKCGRTWRENEKGFLSSTVGRVTMSIRLQGSDPFDDR
jgi:hypothetical protein